MTKDRMAKKKKLCIAEPLKPDDLRCAKARLRRYTQLPHAYLLEEAVASPVIIGPVAMLGFLEPGGTDEGQAIYRRTGHPDIARSRGRAVSGGYMPQA